MREKDPLNVRFGENVRYYREKLGITIELLAEFTHTDEKYLQKLEMGLHSPTLEKIVSIAEVLEVSVNDLTAVTEKFAEVTPREERESRIRELRMRSNKRIRKKNSTSEKDE